MVEILSVTLSNFKVHQARQFYFQPGTNAICGENGAGKTSILEAIAWVLFNHKGAYRTEDLIHNGANSAQVRIALVSSRDQRTYEVQRCTRSGYTLYDPQLGERLDYTRIEEEVLPWLRQHLGVAPGTDLGELFATTIGVPQGTFTSDFLKPAKERKLTFDAILKVEEYRQTADQLLPLEKYARAQVEDRERAIAQYQESLQDWDSLQSKRQTLIEEIDQKQASLQQCQNQLAQLQTEQDHLATQAAQMQQLLAQIERLTAQIQAQTQVVEQLQAELHQAERAVQTCRANRDSYQAFRQTEQALQALEQQRQTQQQLMQQRQSELERLGQYQANLASLVQQQQRLHQAGVEIGRLAPLIDQQTDLEQQQQTINQQVQRCQAERQALHQEETRLHQGQLRLQRLSEEIDQLQGLQASVAQIPTLEEQVQRYQQQLSRIAAATQFEADLRQIVTQAQKRGVIHKTQIQAAQVRLQELQQAVPLWIPAVEEVLATLQTGDRLQEHLMRDLQGILADLAEQILVDRLQQQLQQVQGQLQTARQQQTRFLTLATKQAELQTLQVELTQLQTAIAQAQTRLAAEPDLQQRCLELAQHLAALEDPRGRTRLLQQELRDLPRLELEVQQAQQRVNQSQAAKSTIDQQLAEFATLDQQVQAQQQQQEQHRPAYELYLEHQQLANSAKQRTSQLQTAQTALEQWQKTLTNVQQQRDRLLQAYDPAQAAAVQAAYQVANEQRIALSASLPQMQQRLSELTSRLQELQTIQARLAQAEAEKRQRQQAEKWIKFARKAYRDAGPRITERYVQTIAHEADRLFRELLNRPNVALQWTRDYEIVVQEGAYSRRFVNLSGGEQMCAALAVRLALLKVLADLQIAFFDEPTTNMDRRRREQLAEAIAHLKSFKQLFVISHDDTFEKVTENIILVERQT